MSPLLKNALALIFLQGANYILPLVTLPYLVRTLGIEAFGQLSFSLAVIQYFVILTDYGFNLSATRAVARQQANKNAVSVIFWNVIYCKVLLACAGFMTLVICSNYFAILQDIQPLLFAGYLLVVGNILFPVWLFQGMESMWHVTIASILSKLLTIPFIFFTVTGPEDSWIAAFIHGLSPVVAGVVVIAGLWRIDWIQWHSPRLAQVLAQFVDSWHVFVSTGAVALYTASTTALLGLIAGYTAVGHFTAADKIRQAVQGLVTPVSQALYPRINALIHGNKTAAFYLIRRQLFWQGLTTLTFSIFLGVFAPEIIQMVYGDDHQETVIILQILCPLPLVVGLSNVLGIQTMLPLGMNRQFSRILLLSGIINIGMIIPLSSHFQAFGAAIAVLVTEFMVTLLMATTLRRSEIPIFKREKIVLP